MLTLFHGNSYQEGTGRRGGRDIPQSFSRNSFETNKMVFDLDAFDLKRTPENLWSNSKSIKNIGEIRVDLDSMDRIKRGSNPRCGDDIEVGISSEGETLQSVHFRGRGCSICLASASIMTECVSGKSHQQAQQTITQMREWFENPQSEAPSDSSLAALGAVRKHPARKKCVMLAWVALEETLTDNGS